MACEGCNCGKKQLVDMGQKVKECDMEYQDWLEYLENLGIKLDENSAARNAALDPDNHPNKRWPY